MRIPKKYGEYKVFKCPFCDKPGTVKNPQGVPVCEKHRQDILRQVKCICGQEIEITDGKYGPYGVCLNCGNVSLKKLIEFNDFS